MSTMTTPASQTALLAALAQRAERSGVFGEVRVVGDFVECVAQNSAAPASYRVSIGDGTLVVALRTPDRWLSHSIEADLLNTGDKMEDLLEEELVELGWTGEGLGVDHFRDDAKQFAFQSTLRVAPNDPNALDRAATALLAYEACFRRLGDMDAGSGAE